MFSLICAALNGWVNHGQAGDLERHRAHYDVTVIQAMTSCVLRAVGWIVGGVGNMYCCSLHLMAVSWNLKKVFIVNICIQNKWLNIISYNCGQWAPMIHGIYQYHKHLYTWYIYAWLFLLSKNRRQSTKMQMHHVYSSNTKNIWITYLWLYVCVKSFLCMFSIARSINRPFYNIHDIMWIL